MFIHPKLETENLWSLSCTDTAELRIQNLLFGHLRIQLGLGLKIYSSGI